MRDLLNAGVHFGHRTRYWNPNMKSYIYGRHKKIHIIDLTQTLEAFNNVLRKIETLAKENRKILMVGTKRMASKIVKEHAERAGIPYVTNRWLGGMLTNYKTIRMSVKHYADLVRQSNDPVFAKLTKKEILMRNREMDKLERFYWWD